MSKSKHQQYAEQIISAISELFNEESELFAIDVNDFKDEDDMTEFFHALMNTAPTYLFNQFTGEEKNTLECNHIANKLLIQYDIQGDEK